jgi:hypothetical protein
MIGTLFASASVRPSFTRYLFYFIPRLVDHNHDYKLITVVVNTTVGYLAAGLKVPTIS